MNWFMKLLEILLKPLLAIPGPHLYTDSGRRTKDVAPKQHNVLEFGEYAARKRRFKNIGIVRDPKPPVG